MIEVHRVLQPRPPGETSRDVGVSGEVEIDVDGVGGHDRPPEERCFGRKAAGERLVDVGHQIVRDDRLLEVSDRDQGETLPAAGFVSRRRNGELRKEHPRPDDRSCNQIGEEREVGQEPKRAATRRELLPIDVDQVGDGLEGIEADAQRKHVEEPRRPCLGLDVGPGKDLPGDRGKKRRVLEEQQDPENDRKGEHKERLPFPPGGVQEQREPPHREGHGNEDQGKPMIRPGVEDQGRRRDIQVSEDQIPTGERPAGEEAAGEENE